MRKLSVKKSTELRKSFLVHPSYTDTQIAKLVSVSYPTVQKYREEHLSKMDVEFIKMTAGRFIMEFGEASDYWKLQIEELENLKTDLEPMDILAICKQQAQLREKILFLAAQGEVREVIKVMRSGKLPVLHEV